MPMTPQERVRMQVRGELVPKIAELLYQADKGHQMAKLSDLRTEEARAVYLADALMILEPEQRSERVTRVHVAEGHAVALADKEAEDVMRQARSDVARFGVMRPGWCYVCREAVMANKVTLMITENLHADAHGLCCAKDEQRFEVLGDDGLVYRVKGGQR